MVDDEVPGPVRAAATARTAARADRDWATADRLRAEIEAAGWKVIDHGTRSSLERAHPPDVVAAGAVRYGRSERVPSRLEEPDRGPATVLIVAREDPAGAARALASLATTASVSDAVVVADGLPDDGMESLEGAARSSAFPDGIEIVRTSAVLGQGAAWNIGLRRATGRVVLIVDASIDATGDVVGPLVAALDDPDVAVAGPFGLVSPDLRQFAEVEDGTAAAVEGYLLAFRRSDAGARGPVDEGFRFYRNLDIWWSLVLRDEGRGRAPRRAVVVPGLPLARHDHVAWSAAPPAARERLSKRNFYRVLDRFRDRLDLAVAGGAAPGAPAADEPSPGEPSAEPAEGRG